MKISHFEDHRPLRAAEYPAIGDQLDVIWKQIASLPPDKLLPETTEMLERIKQVKTKFTKPQ